MVNDVPRQTEPNANNALADLLRGMMPGCEVRSENTQTFPDHPGRHADVLITAPGRSPVAVEAEYERLPGMAHCPARQALDAGLSRILGIPDLSTLRTLLASEPVVSNRRL